MIAFMTKQFLYGKRNATVTNAAGVRGFLCRTVNGHYFFRVPHEDGTFTDYTLRHSDLEITISENELAALYHLSDEENVLEYV